MPVAIVCPKCRHRASVSTSFIGQSVHCPKCKATFTVELPDAADPDAVQEHSASLVRQQLEELKTIRRYVGGILAIIVVGLALWVISAMVGGGGAALEKMVR